MIFAKAIRQLNHYVLFGFNNNLPFADFNPSNCLLAACSV